MLKIKIVEKNSIGHEIGLESGDILTHFDGQEIVDILDYEYFEGQEQYILTVQKQDKSKVEFDIEKYEDESLGLVFEDSCYLVSRACRNHCVFCFVDQLPRGMRKTLYFKDDDWKMSFVSGNYVTFTNLTEEEIDRICQKGFSPLFVSVHTTDNNVRRKMLNNPTACDILPLIERFAKNKIVMHTQIVLCPDINDKEMLQKTMEDLFSFYPYVNSLAVVPVGLTKHREKLTGIPPVDKEMASEIIEAVESFSQKCFEEVQDRFVFAADEIYLKAQLPLPTFDFYQDFPQIENGVGLVRKFEQEFDQALQKAKSAQDGDFAIFTGVSASGFMSAQVEKLQKKFSNVKCEVFEIVNNFFGDTVTVSGLITATDIKEQTQKICLPSVVLLPRTMMKETQDVFLDGTTVSQLAEFLQRKIIIVDNEGESLCTILTKGEKTYG